MELSKKAKSLSPSMTLSISAKAKSMIKNGIDLINFTAGEPDFNTPDYIVNAAIKALHEGKTRYTETSGILPLREAICEKFKKFNNIEYTPDNIVVSTGGKQALINALLSIINPDDEVIIPSPFWLSYPEMVKIAGGRSILLETKSENDFKLTIDQLNACLGDKTKCLILNNPSNPTGTAYNREELIEIANWAVKNDIIIISDEIYERLNYDTEHVSIASLGEEIKDLTITISGFSKSYAMTGWRLGYSAANVEITKLMTKLQSHMTSNASSVTQYAGLAALVDEHDEIDNMIKAFRNRRNLVKNEIDSIDDLSMVYPKGAFYAFINISKLKGRKYKDKTIEDSMGIANILLNDFKVALLPGVVFGTDDYLRISYATDEESILKGIDRIKNFIKTLNY